MLGRNPRLVVRPAGAPAVSVPLAGSGAQAVAGVEVEIDVSPASVAWTVANSSAVPVALDAIAIVWEEAAGERVTMFGNGYQSWSPTGARVVGRDGGAGAGDGYRDPSLHPDSFEFIRAVHHSDPGVARAGEVRSELVTAIDLGRSESPRCIGFDGGSRHGGTIRVRRDDDSATIAAEAWLGGAVLMPGTSRRLHGFSHRNGEDVPALLDTWARDTGRNEGARVDAPYQVGWCSWYFYFHAVTEAALAGNLAVAAEWPFTVFQLDDGYQHEIGDWLVTNDRFPHGVGDIATMIARRGFTPGLWMAPFIAAPGSHLARDHPEFFARDRDREAPLMGMFHPEWGGVMWQLDTTRDDVLAHLEQTSRELVAMGYRYLKLDFTFSAAVPGTYADPTRTPAERVRAGYDAVRAGAGDDTFILGCGAPLGAVIGSVDGMRIGPDVAPWWSVTPASGALPGYEAAAPSTRNAWGSTLSRSFMHRRLWLNDPDCVMLRGTDTALTPDERRAWAYAVAVSGGLALVSDDLTRLDDDAHRLLDEVIAVGRAADDEARGGPAPRCEDVLDPTGPRRLTAAGYRLEADPSSVRPHFVNVA